MDVNDETVMRQLTALCLEQALQTCSEKAKWAAEICPDGISGRDALLAFSETILSTNAKVWPAGGEA